MKVQGFVTSTYDVPSRSASLTWHPSCTAEALNDGHHICLPHSRPQSTVDRHQCHCIYLCVCVRNLNDTEHLLLEPWTVRCIQAEQWVHGLPGCCASRLGSCWANTSGKTGFRRIRPYGQRWDRSSNSLHERHPLEEGEHYCRAVIWTVALSYDDMHPTNAPVWFPWF